jgi:hypothetical protein
MTAVGKDVGGQQPFRARHLPKLLNKLIAWTMRPLTAITLKERHTFADEGLDTLSDPAAPGKVWSS